MTADRKEVDPADLPRSLHGEDLAIVSGPYTEAGWFGEANIVTVRDGVRTALYVPLKTLKLPQLGAAGTRADGEPASTFFPPPADYVGPYRAWGPPRGAGDDGRHDWSWEIAPSIDGPFARIRPHALEWWNGSQWIGTD